MNQDGDSLLVGWEQQPVGRWECSTELPICGERSLHHTFDNPEGGSDLISFIHDPVEAEHRFVCTFRVRYGVPPSSANNWQVAMLADLSPLSGEAGPAEAEGSGWIREGILAGVNLTGSDDHLKVWQCAEGSMVELLDSRINFEEEVETGSAPWLRLEVDSTGVVSLFLIPDPEGLIMEVSAETGYPAGEGRLLYWPEGRRLVVRYQYTSARDRNLWIDDLVLEGGFRRDTVPPRIMATAVTDPSRIMLELSEKPAELTPATFTLYAPDGGTMYPEEMEVKGKEVLLRFPEVFPNREAMELQVKGICDIDGNCMPDTLVTVRRNDAVWGDVVFNELMVDPDPRVDLPDQEYVELFNRSGEILDLSGWSLQVNDRSYPISGYPLEPSCMLSPGTFGIVTGIPLPNEGAVLSLYSNTGTLVHGAEYRIPWNGPVWKQEGGWSLESPDPDRVCGVSELWDYSENAAGGTPGSRNSIDNAWPDDQPPVLLGTGWAYPGRVLSLQFSEPVRLSRWGTDLFGLFPGGDPPDSVAPIPPLQRRVDLWLPDPFGEKEEFTVKLPLLVDCSGNLCRTREVTSGVPSTPERGDVVINEIMYDPAEGAPEFIELLNTGSRYIDLRNLRIDVIGHGESPDHPVPLCEASRLLSPGAYAVLTPDVRHFMAAYRRELTGIWIGLKGWKALDNRGGMVCLTDQAGGTLDMACFSDTLHMEMLTETGGVSLERIDATRSGTEAGNWHSAASVVGYSTPGAPNSQRMSGTSGTEILQVEPRVFSPDNDGYQDLLAITLSPGSQGWTVWLVVTDMAGRAVRILANNDLSGTDSLYCWDGEQENGRMSPEGFYVVHARGYHSATGRQWRRKEVVGLVYR